MISYMSFWNTLEQKNISTYKLMKEALIAPTTIQRMRKNESISVRSIDEICQYLNCQITDVIEIIPDGTEVPEDIKEYIKSGSSIYQVIKDREK